MIRLALAALLLASTAHAQSVSPSTNRDGTAPAGAGDPPKLSERRAAGALNADYYSTSTLDVRRLGAVCNGINTTADGPAFATALFIASLSPYGLTIRVPGGRCLLPAALAVSLTGNQALTIQGDGPDATELFIAGSGGGINVSLGGDSTWLRGGTPGFTGAVFRLAGLSLVHASEGLSGNGLQITGTATFNNSIRAATVHDVVFRGTMGSTGSGSTSGWAYGYLFTNVGGTDVSNVAYYNAQSGVRTGVGGGYVSSAGFNSVNHSITRAFWGAPDTCLSVGDYVQGITVSDSKCVGANYGVSLLSPSHTGDWLAVTNSHFDIRKGVVVSNGWSSIHFASNYLLANDASVPSGAVMFELAEGARHMLTGNHVLGNAANLSFARITNSTGQDLYVSASIVGNAADNLSGPFVVIAGSTAWAQIKDNTCFGCSAVGTDARGLSSWTMNTINGTLYPFAPGNLVTCGTTGAVSKTMCLNSSTGALQLVP